MLKALIIDDEKKARVNLKNLLNEYCPEVQLMELADSAQAGLKAIYKHQPDLIFLDIQMPAENGFDLLKKLSTINFEIIFTTAYNQYAIDAIKFSALDYLLKPINIPDLIKVVEKAKIKNQSKTIQQQIDTLLHNQRTPDFSDKKITLPTMEGLVFEDVKNIIRCESDNSYTLFYLTDKKKYLVSRSIKECETLLNDYAFFRVHQSHLINLNHIKQYRKGRSGIIIMNDNTEVPVSVRNKDAFLKRISRW